MALLKTHKLQGGIEIPGTYWMLDGVKNQKLASAVSFRLVGWKDKATRDAYGAAQADVVAKCAAYTALKDAQGDTPESQWSNDVKVQHDLTVVQMQHAQRAAGLIQPMAETQDITIGFDQSAAVLTDVKPDPAKIYGWIKTQPDWKDAVDA